MSRCPPYRRKLRGVTTLELALGVAAIVALGLIGAYVLLPALELDPKSVAARDAAVIQKAAVHWRQQNPLGCPTLSVLFHEQELARNASTDDPWGSRFRVRCDEREVSVVSPGRDRRLGTDDDFSYPQS